jgi:hypothetical protein
MAHLSKVREYSDMITGSLVLAVLFVLVSIAAIFCAPIPIGEQFFWAALKDIGPAIAGSWVLSAGLLTLTAAGINNRAAAREVEASNTRRKEAIRQVCVGEVKSFWDRANHLELHKKLQDHLGWLRWIQVNPQEGTPDLFRRSLGDDWFLLSRVDTPAIGELEPEISALYLSLSARVRNVVSRFNWLNSASYAGQDPDLCRGGR